MTMIERDEAQALAMGWLRGAREGRYAVVTSEGVRQAHANPEGTLAVFWWTRHPVANPVMIVFTEGVRTITYCEMPDELGRAWRRRWERDTERFSQQMERGEGGRTLKSFRLGSFAEFVDLVEGSLALYDGALH